MEHFLNVINQISQFQIDHSPPHDPAVLGPDAAVPQINLTSATTVTSTQDLLLSSFETQSSFFPEAYTLQSRQVQALFMSDNPRGQSFKVNQNYKLCLIHAETPRRWRRITISLVQRPPEGQAFKNPISGILGLDIDFFDTVTNIKVPADVDNNNLCAFKQLIITEDTEEARHELPRKFVAAVDDYGCQQYLESEVATISSISNNSFNVLVDRKVCIEKKLPFTIVADNTVSLCYSGFFANITVLHSLTQTITSGCQSHWCGTRQQPAAGEKLSL